MLSESQTDLATISEVQLAETLSKVKCLRQTEELQARLPAQLAPFESNISIIKPIETVNTNPTGVHHCVCKVKERKIRMSVAVAPSPDSEPHVKTLKLDYLDWWSSSRYLTGAAQSHMQSISFQYGPPHRGKTKAFTGWYDDPGTSETISKHGGIKSVVKEIVRDMGFHGCEIDELEVIEALLGDDGRELLESYAQDGPTLRKIIEDELEVDEEKP